jgi:hypothetical protein
LGVGLLLCGLAAGAPFLIKLAEFARGDMAFAIGLMVLLMVLTNSSRIDLHTPALSGCRNLMLLDEKRPVSTARWSRRPKVPEVPGENERLSGLGHRHDRRVSQVESRSLVPLDELEGTTMLGIRRALEDVGPIEQRIPEDQRSSRVASGPQDEVNLHVDRPGDDDATAKGRKEAYGKGVPAPLAPITC